MTIENQTVSLVWMQTLTGGVDLLESGIPIELGLTALQEAQGEPLGGGCVVFLLPEQGPMYGAWRVLFERRRQIEEEGYSPEHDAGHEDWELIAAAHAYALNVQHRDLALAYNFWPWGPDAWKPSTPIRDLERAGALIAAEIDRRIAAGECGGGDAPVAETGADNDR